jgi:nicotinamidase-related amidase
MPKGTVEIQSEIGVPISRPPIDPRSAALVTVDMIKGQTDRNLGSGASSKREGRFNEYYYSRVEQLVTPAIARLLEAFRERSLPVFHVRVRCDDDEARDWPPIHREHVLRRGTMPCRPGLAVYEWTPGLEPREDEFVMEKHSISPFNSTGIATVARAVGVEHFVFTGVLTAYGVGHAAMDATDHGFYAHVVEDATSGPSQESHDSWLEWAQQLYVRVLSTEDVVAELDS